MFQKYFYQGAIFFVAVFLFFGCVSKEIDNPKTTTIPDWYLQPAKYIPANLLYGAGTGASPEGAKKRALTCNFKCKLLAPTVAIQKKFKVISSSLSEEIFVPKKFCPMYRTTK